MHSFASAPELYPRARTVCSSSPRYGRLAFNEHVLVSRACGDGARLLATCKSEEQLLLLCYRSSGRSTQMNVSRATAYPPNNVSDSSQNKNWRALLDYASSQRSPPSALVGGMGGERYGRGCTDSLLSLRSRLKARSSLQKHFSFKGCRTLVLDRLT